MAGPDSPLHFQTRDFLAALQSAGEAACLSRQVFEGEFQRFEAAQEGRGGDQAFAVAFLRRCAAETEGADLAIAEKGDARHRSGLCGCFARPDDEAQTRIEKPEGEGRPALAAAGERFGQRRGHGPDRRRFGLQCKGDEDNQPPHGRFRRTQHEADHAVKRPPNPLRRNAAGLAVRLIAAQPEQSKQPGDDAQEGLLVVVYGGGQVHERLDNRTKREHMA